jgi:hypothetical protein
MINKWGVMLHSVNGYDKPHHEYLEFENMVDVARFLITQKPPRGYKLVSVEIKEAEQLELELFDNVRGWGG